MAEIRNFDKALEMIRSFERVERLLLITAGTLQSALSAYFSTPIRIEVTSQSELEDGTIERLVDLVRHDTGAVVCRATTTISVARDDVRELIMANEIGLGRILLMLEVPATFELTDVGSGPQSFWRLYRLEAESVSFLIREEFLRSALADAD